MAKILYVDDEPDNLTVFESVCDGHFEVVTATNGEAALELVARDDIAVLLADQLMPGMTGVEVAERAAQEHPDVVRLLVTAGSDLSVAIDAINRGQIRGYIRKPWKPVEMLAILKESLSTHATRRRVRELEKQMLITERVYTLGIVTAGIAHELRNPLTVLSSGARVVRKRISNIRAHIEAGRSETSELEAALGLIDSIEPFLSAQIDSCASMTEICHSFEVPNYTIDASETCDLAEVAITAAQVVVANGGGSGPLNSSLDSVPAVKGNRHRLGRVIINLLVNAFDAVADRDEGLVSLRLFEGEGAVVLEVRDNGPGIAADSLHRIFEPFFSTKEGGTGIGLAMSKKIVEEVGGTLTCQSEAGEGSVFRMSLDSLP